MRPAILLMEFRALHLICWVREKWNRRSFVSIDKNVKCNEMDGLHRFKLNSMTTFSHNVEFDEILPAKIRCFTGNRPSSGNGEFTTSFGRAPFIWKCSQITGYVSNLWRSRWRFRFLVLARTSVVMFGIAKMRNDFGELKLSIRLMRFERAWESTW